MPFELVPKHKATIVAIEILSLKMGQVDVQPAVCITLKVPLPNSKLAMLSPTLREFLYENSTNRPATQQQLEGVEVVSDKPNLTAAASAIGAIHWEYEQTGCKLCIYNGVSGHEDITLTDATVRKLKLEPREGGTVDHVFQVYTAAVDAEVIGELGVLKSLERDIELTLPEPLQQPLPDKGKGSKETPESALAKSVKGETAKA